MILYPAIDMRGGKAVRLAQGDFAQETVYDADPLSAARAWVEGGARWLHVVDLDGARDGAPANLGHLERIAGELGVPVQFGGGLRSLESIDAALAAGAERVILGTAAFSDVDFLDDAVAKHGNRVTVSVDVRDGHVASAGWTQQTEMEAAGVIEHLQRRGVKRLVYSSIERDGMLTGPDLEEVKRVAEAVRGSFIYSGGIGTLDHLRALAALRQVNLSGVIVGKALYERRFDVAQAQAALRVEPAGRKKPAGSASG
ncbi:MAG TPA: 1-(5-phosphoribosyl)-5-[(5-phosphoribosylamino)methylideneamino]imidazole-4-carboxamide isomerase [Conexibacter sp.]|nr:1-(5-phosphoribosyl)-5-[(5-phosphoribosylamino)methylideneamino]imidazole-4-carboxamide isomerase [Conexibacter sp.]